MARGNPLTGPIILGVILAAIFAVLHPGAGLVGLFVLIFFGGLAKGLARRSDTNRYWLLALYCGPLLGFIISGFIISVVRATRPQ